MDQSNYSNETRQIIELLHEARREFQSTHKFQDVDVKPLQTDGLDLLYFMVCLEPESVMYGTGFGAFAHPSGRVYRFSYNIHTPRSKGPHRSNQMTNIEEVVLEDVCGVKMTKNERTDFGGKAFWIHTSMDALDEDSKRLRRLMESLKAYCRKEDLCGRLRKLDKAHEQWAFNIRAARVMQNTYYGVTGTPITASQENRKGK